MYIPKSFQNNNIEKLHQFIERFNFATLISHNSNETHVTHVPVMLNREQGPYDTLVWHMAIPNPHAKEFNGSKNALFIFHGPHAYISPAWYKSAPNVPTWNYAAVHAVGTPERVSKEQLSRDLTKMVDYQEAQLNENTQYSIPDKYKAKLLDHIDGFKLEITRIEGKFKLGQNRSLEDQAGMLYGLKNQKMNGTMTLIDLIESFQEAEEAN